MLISQGMLIYRMLIARFYCTSAQGVATRAYFEHTIRLLALDYKAEHPNIDQTCKRLHS
jgi:hypothetical protein